MWVPTMKRVSTPEAVGQVEEEGAPSSLTVEALRGRALAMLARREHSRLEIQRKLKDMGGEAQLVEQVLDELAQRKFQSDERFAASFIRSRAERGYGPLVIARDLKERGLPAEVARQTLEQSGYDWYSHALGVRQRRFGSLRATHPKERARQYRFLQYRGFSGGQIVAALGRDALSED